MRDPQRITEAHAGEVESDLLRAMRDDAPSARARHRTLAALGVGGAALGIAASTTSAAAAAATSGKAPAVAWLAVSKWLALGIVSGAGTVGLAHEIPKLVAKGADSAVSSARRTLERQAFGKAVQTPVPSQQPDEQAPVLVSELPLELIPETPERPRAAKAALTAKDSQPQLAAEVASLDVARRATLAKEPARALELLDLHEQRFPRGALSPELLVLRIEALAASGRQQMASKLGRQFLEAHATSPHAEKVRALIASGATH